MIRALNVAFCLRKLLKLSVLSTAGFSAVSEHPPHIFVVFLIGIDRCLRENFVSFTICAICEGTDCELKARTQQLFKNPTFPSHNTRKETTAFKEILQVKFHN